MTQPFPPKPLGQLLADVPILSLQGDATVSCFARITADSRTIGPGDLYVALRGATFDGHRFVPEAVARGAAAVVVGEPVDSGSVPQVLVADARYALALMAAAFYDHPSRKLRLIGVTGTDGKTSTTTLTAAILRASGRRVAHSTTVEFHNGVTARANQAGYTTPPAPAIQRELADAVTVGVEAAVLEVSSHALAIDRVAGCEFDVAVFTNLAREHLDFHATLEEYRAAKLKLFQGLQERRTKPWTPVGIVNGDDASASYFSEASPGVVRYGLDAADLDITARDLFCGPEGSRFTLSTPQGEAVVTTRLLGRFNVRNWLAAAGAALACGATPADVARAAEQVAPVPGRMERVDAGQPFSVYVDFAHTPQGLAAALDSVRELHPGGRSIAVFGHAGRRDTDHRRGLVEAARGRCDLFILTMDDPYDEDPMLILETMRREALAMGCVDGADFLCVLDRREAFQRALELAKPGDAVLLAGRGHETTIPLGADTLPFHDAWLVNSCPPRHSEEGVLVNSEGAASEAPC